MEPHTHACLPRASQVALVRPFCERAAALVEVCLQVPQLDSPTAPLEPVHEAVGATHHLLHPTNVLLDFSTQNTLVNGLPTASLEQVHTPVLLIVP